MKSLFPLLGVVILAAGLAPNATAATSLNARNCGHNGQLYHQTRPAISNPRLSQHTYRLCFAAFNTTYSGISRTPLWSAEHLTKARLQAHKGIKRLGRFHAEQALPKPYRSELSDYRHSGYDRGHMAPAADMPSRKAEYQSFSLANMVPQFPHNNRYLWEGIEVSTRNLAWHGDDVYVVSGPIFRGKLKSLHGRVLIPTYLFKAIYDKTRGAAGVYLVANKDGNDYSVVSLDYLRKLTGIDPFPGLPASVKAHAWNLPTPHPQRHVLAAKYRVAPEDLP